MFTPIDPNPPLVVATSSESARRLTSASHWPPVCPMPIVAGAIEMGDDLGEPLGLRIRKRPQQDPIDDGVDGRVRADAQRERQHGGDGEDGRLQQQADGVSQVAHTALDGSTRRQVDPGVSTETADSERADRTYSLAARSRSRNR